MTTNATTDALTRTCAELINRRKNLMFNNPAPRYMPASPYTNTGYTQAQLDMRRKAEILQYNKNGNNKITNAKKWVNVVNGKEQRRKYSSYVLKQIADGNGEPCENDLYMPTLTTASGVPGPPMYLRYDPTVPLYNYNSQQIAYGTQPLSNSKKWLLVYDTNIISNSAKVATLNIQSGIDKQRYTYSLTTSVAFTVAGTCTQDSSFSVKIPAQNISIQVKYGDMPVLMQTTPTVTFDSTMDVSGSIVTSQNGQTTAFSGSIYMGNVTFSNIVLPTTLGYTYDFFITYVPSSTKSLNISTLGVSLIYNIKNTTLLQTSGNLTFTKPPSANAVTTLIIDGV
jgi:hypothetical protein